MKRLLPAVLIACLTLAAAPAAPAAGVTLTLYLNQRGPAISPTLFGLMFEDINHSGDGGIYAELIRNRAFRDDPAAPTGWTLVTNGPAHASMALDASQPVPTTALTTTLRLSIARIGTGGRAGIANGGYDGIPVYPRTTYRASFYARASAGLRGPLTVGLESTGGRVYATATLPGVGTAWRHYAVTLTTPPSIRPSQNNRFVITAAHAGTLWFDLVSLFPPTWRNRPNGLRVDLTRLLADLHPGFLRFPGGNFLEGQTIATRFEWKQTIGDLARRPGHPDPWGYRSSDGLGLLEYLEWCEDLHMVPVLAVYAGYSLDGAYVPAGPRLRPYVQDALDEIQYATASTRTPWGARRAADGHPAPFDVPYVEIGNEDWVDRSGSYDGRFAQFYDAIRTRYPAIKLIATAPVHSRRPDVLDQHFYQSSDWFIVNTTYYDAYDRGGPKIFVGEYAAQTDRIGQGTATLEAALGEAAWMTGLERNADLVVMASYAPLLQNVHGYQWTPDLISFDSLNSYGSPSYYVQKLFSLNRGDVVVPATLGGSDSLFYVASRVRRDGTVYAIVVNVATWAQPTRIEIAGATSIAPTGTATVLTSGNINDTNSLRAPMKVAPRTRALRGLSSSFRYTFPANSVTVLRLHAG